MNTKPKYHTLIISGSIVVAVATIVITSTYAVSKAREKYQQMLLAEADFTRPLERIDNVLHYGELTHWQREGWEIRTFFHTPEAIAACEFISAKKTQDLLDWMNSGGDINLTGDHGMTLLFWAMLDRNMRAFEVLLLHGADPDLVLTEGVELKNGQFMHKHDSVLFAATEFMAYEFLLLSLPYMDEPNQTDLANRNLLHRLTSGIRYMSVSPQIFAELVRAGVHPNVRSESSGSVPVVRLVSSDRPASGLAMLIEGADPMFESREGDSVASIVRSQIESQARIVSTADFQKLVNWLVYHQYLDLRYLANTAEIASTPLGQGLN